MKRSDGIIVTLIAAGVLSGCKSDTVAETKSATESPATAQAATIVPAPPAEPAFNRVVYVTADGRKRITMVSGSELEIGQNGENYVCKYSREENVVRAVMTGFGSSQAVYFNVFADGLVDKDGVVFYSPAALERVKVAAAEAERNKELSKVPTRTILEFNAYKWAHDEHDIFYVKLTDVGITYTSSRGGNFGAGFGEINRIDVRACDSQMNPCEVRIHTTGYYMNIAFHFRGDAERREFVRLADEAIRAWKGKYPGVEQRQYVGVQDDEDSD